MAKSSKKPTKPDSHPVGFRLKLPAYQLYSSLAVADRDRPVGTMCAIILEQVQPLAALIESDRTLTVEAILERAGLTVQASEAIRKFNPQNGQG